MEDPKVKGVEVKEADDTEIVSLLKPKREQSEKQKAVWAKAQQTRLDNAAAKREVIAKIKDEKQAKREIKEAKTLANENKKQKVVSYVVQSDSEEEEEIIIVKKKKNKTQPKIIYQEDSEEEEEEEPPPSFQRNPRPTKKVPQIHQGQSQDLRLPIKPVIRFF